ncbi:MAG: ABC transporter ATP-binding protein [Leucobacter sp.]
MTSLLTFENLRITAPDGRILLNDMNMKLNSGMRMAIMGPSGAGKTTLLRALLDDLPAGFTRTGSISLGGEEHQPKTPSTRKRIADTIAYLPQDAGASLTPTMRIGVLLREAASASTPSAQQIVEEILDTVGLPHDRAFLRRRPWQLSGGQQRRVALTRALARERPLLILDEPTAGLDPCTRMHVLDLLAHLSDQLSSALLMVTHDHMAADTLHCEQHHLQDGPQAVHAGSVQRSSVRSDTKPILAMRNAKVIDAGGGTITSSLTLELGSGQITALRGTSGSGKTTIARTFAGLLPLAAGTLELHDSRLPSELRHRTVAQRRAIQLVRQNADDAFNPRRTIHQSLLSAGPSIDPVKLLPSLHLPAELLERRPHQLSGGQRQRFALLRALSLCPDVLLLDEPTSALDPQTALQVLATVRTAADGGAAVLLITHDGSPIDGYVDRALTLVNGTLDVRNS